MLNHTIDQVCQRYFIETFISVEDLLKEKAIVPNIILLDHFLSGFNGMDSITTIQKTS